MSGKGTTDFSCFIGEAGIIGVGFDFATWTKNCTSCPTGLKPHWIGGCLVGLSWCSNLKAKESVS